LPDGVAGSAFRVLSVRLGILGPSLRWDDGEITNTTVIPAQAGIQNLQSIIHNNKKEGAD
jgi:hypothetical protein